MPGEDAVRGLYDASYRGAYRLAAAGPRVVAARGPLTAPEVLRLDDAGRATSWVEFR